MSHYEAQRCEHCGAVRGRAGEPLTQRQRQLVDFLAERIQANGFAPSFEEIAANFEYRSLATVHEHLVTLERKGWIRRIYNTARAIEMVGPA